jgi:PAS domain S-box-containing protein
MAAFNLNSEAFSFDATDASGPGFYPGGLLFDRAPVPMWIFDRESLGFLAVNDAAVLKYRYSRAEFLAMTIGEIRSSADLPQLRRELARPVHDASPVKGGEWKHRSKAGEIFDVEITSTAVRFQGRDAEMVAAHDVTGHKREQQGISVRYALNRLLLESSSDATEKALSALCDWMGFDLVEMWCPYAGNQMLLRKLFWQPPDEQPIAPVASPVLLELRQGVLARAWFSGWPNWIEDLSQEPGYQDRIANLQQAGISDGIVFAVRDHNATTALVALLSLRVVDGNGGAGIVHE